MYREWVDVLKYMMTVTALSYIGLPGGEVVFVEGSVVGRGDSGK